MLKNDEYKTLGGALIGFGVFKIVDYIAVQVGLYYLFSGLIPYLSPAAIAQLPLQIYTSDFVLMIFYLFLFTGEIVFGLVVGGIFSKYGKENNEDQLATGGTFLVWSILFPLIMSFGLSFGLSFLFGMSVSMLTTILSFISLAGIVFEILGWVAILVFFAKKNEERGAPVGLAGGIVLTSTSGLIALDWLIFGTFYFITGITSAVGCILMAAGLIVMGTGATSTYRPPATQTYTPTPRYLPSPGMLGTRDLSSPLPSSYMQPSPPTSAIKKPLHCPSCGMRLPTG
ncbi:MAG: hypothetical protein ACFFCS_04715, partial [Candidatus Hodarchaeota archaeon]